MTEQEEFEQQAAALAEQLQRQQEVSDFLWLMNDPRGRRFIWRTLARCRVFQPSIGPTDAATNFNEGQRNVGLFHLGEINELCPELFPVMAAESASAKPTDKPQEFDQ